MSLKEKLDITIYWEMSGSFANENTFSYNARSSHHYTTNKQDDVVILHSHAQSKVWRHFLKNDPTEL